MSDETVESTGSSIGTSVGSKKTPDNVRCSEIDRVLTCPASLIEAQFPYQGETPAAHEGTAAHRVIEYIITSEEFEVEEVCERFAAQYGCELETLTFLAREAWRAWGALNEHFPEPRLEYEVACAHCRGVADVVSFDHDHASVIDWKFGYSTEQHRNQLAGYALCLRERYGMPSTGYIQCWEVHARHGEWYRNQYDDIALDELGEQLQRVIKHPRRWAPSTSACRYCPARMECAARMGHAQNCAQLIDDIVELGVPRESIAQVHDRAEFFRAALNDYDTALRDHLRDGDITLPDGRTIVLRETLRQTILADRAWPLLRDRLGWTAADMMELIALPKGALMERIKIDLPRGEKAKGARDIMDALVSTGAVKTMSSYRKEIK